MRNTHVAATGTAVTGAESALYRRVWRWHFYAGLVCLPFLLLLATTGGLYLFKDEIEAWTDAELRQVASRPGPALDAQALVARALVDQPGVALRYQAPAGPGHSAQVGVGTAAGLVTVYLDPADGRVLGRQHDERRPMAVVKRIHSLVIAGPVANLWVEVVAGWAIVLVVSGLFLWWPRGRRGGVYSLRQRPAQRLWWRDLHAVTGAAAAVAIVFLAASGMPWSAFWGEQFGRLSSAWGLGVPASLWGPPPPSAPPLAGLQAVPWGLGQLPLPPSAMPAAAHHHDHAAAPAADAASPGLGLDQALQRFAQLGLPLGTPVRLPQGERGVYSALHFPDDVQAVRVVHLDRYTGAVLADIGYADYGMLGRITEWGISIHTGRQFGWINKLVMLAGCLAVVLLALSALLMWWKRRPPGRLAAPPRRAGDRAAAGAIAVALLLGLLYPLLGASMLVALLVDALVPVGWHQRLGL